MQRVYAFIVIAILLMLPANRGEAQVEFSGFFDVQYLEPEEKKDFFTGFHYGQFEIDVATEFMDRIRTDGSLVFNTESQEFEAGEGYLTLDLSSRQSSIRPNSRSFIRQTQIQVGQFYVPFGIDYRVSSSIDRSLVHVPLMNRRTINSWISVGSQLYMCADEWNTTLFAVRSLTEGITVGGRIGLKVSTDAEIGFSYAREIRNAQYRNSALLGTDFEWFVHQFSLKGEAVFSQGVLNGATTSDQEVYHWGYYVQGKYDILRLRQLPMFLVGRYGQWEPLNGVDSQTIPPEQRITVGVGVRLAYQTELRVEYMSNLRDDDTLTFQLAVGF